MRMAIHADNETRRIEPGDEVVLRARVSRTWVDSDARRRNVSLSRWAQLELPSGGRCIVPVCDLELAQEREGVE